MSSKLLQTLGITFFFIGIVTSIAFFTWQPVAIGLVAFIACACVDASVNDKDVK